MENLFSYYQELPGKKINRKSTCDINLFTENRILHIESVFNFISNRKLNKEPNEKYSIQINLKNGDIKINSPIIFRADDSIFKILDNVCNKVFIDGGKKPGFWGLNYKKNIEELFIILKEKLFINKDSYFYNKNYLNQYGSKFYQIIVDYYFYKKGIKPHNNIYLHILQILPKEEHLKNNDNKIFPAMLDDLGIKSKYFIGKLSTNKENNVNLKALKTLCNFFGENYIDFIKKFNWIEVCKIDFTPTKFLECKDINEKRNLVEIINDADKNGKLYDVLFEINRILLLRESLETETIKFSLPATRFKDLEKLSEKWGILKSNINKGYILKHSIPEDIVSYIEEPIIVGYKKFIPQLLLTETDFILEGMKMKNCLKTQFKHASVNMFLSLTYNNHKIDLQFRKGELVQAYGKANSKYNKKIFDKPINILTERILKHKDLTWSSEKIKIQ